MATSSVISLFSAITSIIAIFILMFIFQKVYQEDYKKPWLYIGISAFFFALSQLFSFFFGFYNLVIINISITGYIIYVMEFVGMVVLTYGLLLELLILRFYKGKFVKFKFVPVQEGTLGGELDLNISTSNSYFAYKKERKFLFEQFYKATMKGFEGFLITEDSPKSIRKTYGIEKSPIAWITQIDENLSFEYKNEVLDSASGMVDPLHINNIITYIDNFLESSESPFIVIETNQLFRSNNYVIVEEFLKYISNKIQNYKGVLIVMLNVDVLSKEQLSFMKEFLRELE